MPTEIKLLLADDGFVKWENVDVTPPDDPPDDPPPDDPPPDYPEEQGAPYMRSDGGSFTPVTRVNDLRPLSHQNDLRYAINAAFSDDFTSFDTAKWAKLPGDPWQQGEQLGRPPARHARNNIAIEDGELTIRFRQVNPAQTDPDADDFDPASTMDSPTPYGGYTSGCVYSKEVVKYGYFEIEAKIMPSAGSSAFWLAWGPNDQPGTEIDVFEMGGKGNTPDPAGDELPHLPSNNRYNMNAHLFEGPLVPNGNNEDRTWVAPFDFKDAYHVYGLQWDADFIRWYVDGVLIRVKANVDQHSDMKVIFDSEAFWGGQANGGWFGVVDNADLPSKFRIKYVRSWTKS